MKMTAEQAQLAANQWGFNCGPGALCGVLDLTPDELRPDLLDFEQKRYTNPTLMQDILRRRGVPFRLVYRGDGPAPAVAYPPLGLVRVQWAGPWTKEGVPMSARYRQTHWAGVRSGKCGREVFDVNAIAYGGWLPWAEWAEQLVPWLIRACVPRASGEWWPTHVLAITIPQMREEMR